MSNSFSSLVRLRLGTGLDLTFFHHNMFYLLDHDNKKDNNQNCEDFVNGVFPGPISNPIDGYQKKVVIIKGASSGRYILDSMHAMGIRLFSQMIFTSVGGG